MNREYTERHVPVMLNEVVDNLVWKVDGVYVDCTVGEGGHTEKIAERINERGLVVGLDVDSEVLEIASKKLTPFQNVRLVKSSYVDVPKILNEMDIHKVDGFVVDLGVSTYQLKSKGRGFSFNVDEPLDMRMDFDGVITAADVVNTYPEEKLSEIIHLYGEERHARKIAKLIVENRPVKTTGQLVEIIKKVIPPKERFSRKRHFATKTFQAIRIEVNKELDNIKKFLDFAPEFLSPGGRLVIITFHSLEDRLVKHTLKNNKNLKLFDLILPTKEEIESNSRSRSAKLRIAERV